MNVLIFGKGQMGLAFKDYFIAQGNSASVAEGVDIRRAEQVASAIAAVQPDVVINCAAKTNLDWCEQNRLECFDTNTLGADTVGKVCLESKTYLVHVSTGCIQASKTEQESHKEDDAPTPTSFYSWTKYWADQMLLLRHTRSGLKLLIVRPRQPVSAKASTRNALLKMLTFTKFIDTPNSMTVIEDFIPATDQLIKQNATGVFNVSNPGIMTPLRTAELLKEYIKPDMHFEKISKEELNKMTLAERIDSVLDTSKLEAAGIHLTPIEERLRQLLPELKKDLEAHPEVLDSTKKETVAKLSLRSQTTS